MRRLTEEERWALELLARATVAEGVREGDQLCLALAGLTPDGDDETDEENEEKER